MTAVAFASTRSQGIVRPHIVGWTLVAAVTFNAVLALINAHVFALSRNHVMLAEAIIICVIVAMIAFRATRPMLRWISLLLIVVGLGIVLGLLNGSIDPKYIRDVVLIPVFILFGMLYARHDILKPVAFLQAIVFVILMFEGLSPQLYGTTFNIIAYYINTRDFVEAAFWNPEFLLFLSATRPVERFMMSFLELHRLSSIFLEPVSLGNYVVIITIFIVTFWRRMSNWQKLFFILTTFAILVGSDGRLALVTCFIVIAGYFVFPRMPAYSNVLYLPVLLALSALWVFLMQIPAEGDTFPGRVSFSLDLLSHLDVAALIGLDQRISVFSADSGIVYFIVTQSLIGVVIIWLFVALGLPQDNRERVLFVHATCLYLPLNLLVSYSLFSIKTASLLWFVYGYLYAQSMIERSAGAGRRRIARW
jgi:putative polymerase